MGELELPQDFKEFLKLLRSHGVKYLLIGGYAVSYHGYVRPTGDMDIWILPEPENVARIIDALGDFGFGSTGLSPELFLAPRRIVRIGNAPLRLEIMNAISGVEFEECYRTRITESMHGIEVDLIDLGNLKRNKAASGRLKDLDDLSHLG
jgi:predicted nucleotidyltransferase